MCVVRMLDFDKDSVGIPVIDGTCRGAMMLSPASNVLDRLSKMAGSNLLSKLT